MRRVALLIALGVGVVIAVAVALVISRAPNDRAPRPPNVLFIMADDLRLEAGMGGLRAHAPNLVRLNARATRFYATYCQQAVCNPSRSSLLTGLRPDTIGLWNNSVHFRQLRPDVVTLPQRFKLAGYETRGVGKIFHNWHTAEKGDARAWSAPEFLHYANHGDDAPIVSGALPPNQVTGVTGLRKYGQVPMTECRDVPDEAYYDGRVAAEAVRTLAEVKDRPFFLAVGFWKPHAPFNAPAKYWSLYRREQFADYDGRRPAGAPAQAFHESSEILGKSRPPTPAEAAEMRHGYFANIAYLDAQVGKLLDALDRSGVADRTVIVFVSDHGYHLGEHSLWGKTSNFEFDARVPMLISLPGQTRGAMTASFAELIDLYPTCSRSAVSRARTGWTGRACCRCSGIRRPRSKTRPSRSTRGRLISTAPRTAARRPWVTPCAPRRAATPNGAIGRRASPSPVSSTPPRTNRPRPSTASTTRPMPAPWPPWRRCSRPPTLA